MEAIVLLFFLSLAIILGIVVLLLICLFKITSLNSKMQVIVNKFNNLELELERLSKGLKTGLTEDITIKTEETVKPTIIDDVSLPEEKIEDKVEEKVEEKIEEKVEEVLIEPSPVLEELKTQSDSTERPKIEEVIFSREKIKESKVELRKPRKKSSFELFFSENILTKFGIVTLVLGIGFFVKYAIDQNWINEISRVGIGILTGAILIGIAHKLRKSLSVFSSILVGGGISVFYITITLAFREYELFSQTTAFIILILITIFSVVLSLLYDRKELAIFSLLGGFAAPLMISTGHGDYVVLFSYILILNTGMLYLSFKKNWIIIVYIAFVLTSLFQLVWVFNNFENEYLGASVFAGLFFIQFYLVSLINAGKTTKLIIPHLLLIILNNMVFLGIFLYVFNIYEGINFKGIITIAFALINGIVLQYLWKKDKIDKLFIYTVLGVVVSLVTLAIPIQLKGHFITMFWATEVVVLLYLHIKSKLNIFFIGFVLVSALALISYCIDIAILDDLRNVTLIFNRMFITGLVVFGSFLAALILLKKHEIKDKIIPVYGLIIRILAFVVPFLELKKEIAILNLNDTSFESIVLLTYTISFSAIIFLIFSKSKLNYIINWIVIGLFTLVFNSINEAFNYDIFVANILPLKYYAIVFLSLPALVSLAWTIIKNPRYSKNSVIVRWILPVLLLVNLCTLIDNTSVLIHMNVFKYDSGKNNLWEYYYEVKSITIRVIYPIVWGITALLLTIVGIKLNKVILRQISLALIGITIVKFYAIDVWEMSEGGKIISFVLLGIIILVISFLMNKIKVLLGTKDVDDKENDVIADDQK